MTTSEQPSLLRRAAHTPARDWVRGRISGRLDWRAAVDRADLPGPVAELVGRVVGRSRLWRLEKVDLAAELCAHFADGLDSGRDMEQLMKDFGDAHRATRLIKRAKKRNRHWTYRGFVHTCQGIGAVLLALVLAYALLAWRFFASEPTVTRNYTAEYNETVEAIPEADRAWPLYLETYAMINDVPDELLHSWPAPAPEHPRYAEALAYLESQRDVLDLAHRAALLPRLGAPFRDQLDPRIVAADSARHPEANLEVIEPSENPMLIGVLLPELGHMRNLSKLLAFDAHVAADAGDAPRAARDIQTMLGVARHAGDRPVLISGLVEIAIYHLASNTAAQIIHARPGLFSDEQLRAVAHAFAATGMTDLSDGLKGERSMFEDMVQRVYSDDGEGNGHMTAEGLRTLMMFSSLQGSAEDLITGPSPLGPLAALLVADRASLMAKYNGLMAKIEARVGTPMWEYDHQPRVTDETEVLASDPMDRVRYFPIVILIPALDRAAEQGEYVAQWRDGLLTGIALELYRRERGEYPASLEALTPGYLPEIPPDRYTGTPLKYELVDGRPRLWSIGVDRDDDGGVMPEPNRAETYHWLAPEAVAARLADPREGNRYNGDWVVWPIVYEPMASDNRD